MVIFEGALAHRYLHDKMDQTHLEESSGVALSFGKAASFIMMGYLCIKLIGIAADNNWHYLATGYGLWFLLELIGFVAIPAFLYAISARERNIKMVRIASILTVLGIVLNRLNVSVIAFNWHLSASERYFPSWKEFGISLFIVTIGIIAYRFIATNMPILYEHPDFKSDHQ